MPPGFHPTDAETDDRTRARPAWLPWAGAAAAVLVLVLLVTWLTRGEEATPAAGTDPAAQTTPAEKTTSAAPETSAPAEPPGIEVVAADYQGLPKDEAKARLEALGLKVKEQPVDNDGTMEQDTVVDVVPVGTFRRATRSRCSSPSRRPRRPKRRRSPARATPSGPRRTRTESCEQRIRPPLPPPPSGKPTIGGRYEVDGLLGRGGMAEVRKGTDTRLGRVVAIKRLRTDLASDPTFQARFRREAQSAASLNHPAIVSVYDTGEEVGTDRRHGRRCPAALHRDGVRRRAGPCARSSAKAARSSPSGRWRSPPACCPPSTTATAPASCTATSSPPT